MAVEAATRRSRSGRLARFVAAFSRLLSPDPRARACDSLARLLLHWRGPVWALPFYRKAAHLAPSNRPIWLRRAAAAVRAGRLEEAALSYRRLARMDPDNPRAHARLAAVYDAMGAPRAAMDVCGRALRRFPHSAVLHRRLGRLLVAAGAIPAALRSLHRAADLSPTDCDTQYFIALALRRAGRLAEARSALRRALAMKPHDPKLYYALGLCYDIGDPHRESASLFLKGLAAERLTGESATLDRIARDSHVPRWRLARPR